MKVTASEASIFVDADGSVVKCLVLSRQGDGCGGAGSIPVYSISYYVSTSFVYSSRAQWLSAWSCIERSAGSIPLHSICCYVSTSFDLFVGLELDLGLWLIFLY